MDKIIEEEAMKMYKLIPKEKWTEVFFRQTKKQLKKHILAYDYFFRLLRDKKALSAISDVGDVTLDGRAIYNNLNLPQEANWYIMRGVIDDIFYLAIRANDKKRDWRASYRIITSLGWDEDSKCFYVSFGYFMRVVAKLILDELED